MKKFRGTTIVLLIKAFCLLISLERVCADTLIEWPQFHGSRYDNRSDETGLLNVWPQEGPKLLWTARGIGHGFSSVAIAGGFVYTTGNIGKDAVITALDLNGKILWTVKNGPAWENPHPGTRGTPTIRNGHLYHEGAHGDIVCLNAQTGKLIWSVNILKKFNGRNISWGLAESLLIDGNHVICSPGGEEAGIVALDKNTGETCWICRDTKDKPSYSSPIVLDYKGVRQIVKMMARSVVGVNADSGELLWRYDYITPYDENTMTTLFHDGCIFFSTRSTGARLLRLNIEGKKCSVQEVWENKEMDNQHGGVVLVNGYLYGDRLSTKGGGPLACLEWSTGKQIFAEPGIGRCSFTFADGMLYLLDHHGTVALAPATPNDFKIKSQFTIPAGGKGPSWAHPVVCGGRLYIRHGDFLFCYSLKKE